MKKSYLRFYRVSPPPRILALILVIAAFCASAGAAQAQVTCSGKAATIVGTPGNNVLNGTAGPDVIAGLGGNDTINGLGGNDTIRGGKGRDRLFGGKGRDILIGEDGNDQLFGGNGNDGLFGGRNDDTLDGGVGNDSLDGGRGVNTCVNGENNTNCNNTAPPTISITSPVNLRLFNSSPITVSGTFNNAKTVEINGISATLSGGTFRAQVPT